MEPPCMSCEEEQEPEPQKSEGETKQVDDADGELTQCGHTFLFHYAAGSLERTGVCDFVFLLPILVFAQAQVFSECVQNE